MDHPFPRMFAKFLPPDWDPVAWYNHRFPVAWSLEAGFDQPVAGPAATARTLATATRGRRLELAGLVH